jgi:hypothetical protein
MRINSHPDNSTGQRLGFAIVSRTAIRTMTGLPGRDLENGPAMLPGINAPRRGMIGSLPARARCGLPYL